MVNYEWILQELTDDGDVLKNHFCGSLKEALSKQVQYQLGHSQVVLSRSIWDAIDKSRDDITEAVYYDNGLDTYFDNGMKVPNKYLNERG